MTLHNGDCLEVLRTLESESIDSIVTDPPAGIAFMSKGWDSDKGGRDHWIAWMAEVMAECLRLLKPGGHALVWALPRTSHWTATACENAGFEIRDVIHHLFGSGFPKSHDISKAIDREAGAERGITGPKDFGRSFGGQTSQTEQGYRADTGKVWDYDSHRRDAPATPEAVQWAGFGTALKPAVEEYILCRKPFPGTVAANVLEHGTGGLNIDAGRIATGGRPKIESFARESDNSYGDGLNGSKGAGTTTQGRFPSNLILTHSAECGESCAPDCPCGEIDKAQVSGGSKGKTGFTTKSKSDSWAMSDCEGTWPASTGLPSSYFKTFRYHPKISAQDREDGNTHATVKPTDLMRYFINLITPPKGIVLDPFMGSGSTGKAAILDGFDFIGIEQDADYFKIAESRIRKAGIQPGLF